MQEITFKSIASFESLISESKKPTFIVLSQDNCGWCDVEVETLDTLKAEGDFDFDAFILKVDKSDQEIKDFFKDAGVRVMPTLILANQGAIVKIDDPFYKNVYFLNQYHDEGKIKKVLLTLKDSPNPSDISPLLFGKICMACKKNEKGYCRLIKAHVEPNDDCKSFGRKKRYAIYG